MTELSAMTWIETRKALRSKLPLWTALGSLFMPFGIAFLLFVARNPQISQRLGLVSAKADLVAYSATDWPAYMKLVSEIISTGGFFLFVLVVSWIFGREFADGTVKDMLAVPVPRRSIILAKFIVALVWSIWLTVVLYLFSLLAGWILNMPGASLALVLQSSGYVLVTALLVVAVAAPFALFASLGRGYLLPLSLVVLMLVAINVMVLLGWGEYFPWAVPALYVMGDSPLPAASYWIVAACCLGGMLLTHLWWKYADQPR